MILKAFSSWSNSMILLCYGRFAGERWWKEKREDRITFAERNVADMQQKAPKARDTKTNRLCKHDEHSWLVQPQDKSLDDV